MNEIVVGIDIGTTSAIAIFDKSEKLLFLKSKKEYSISEIVEDVLKIGKPILICTDKVKVPYKIRKIASSFSCKIYHPLKEPSEKSKIRLTKDYEYNNDHERDAIFSAIKGLKSIKNKEVKPLKIEVKKSFVSNKKTEFFDDRNILVKKIIELKEENKKLREIIEKMREKRNLVINEVIIEKNEELERKIKYLEKIIKILKIWDKESFVCLKMNEIDENFLLELIKHIPKNKIVIASNNVEKFSILVDLEINYVITEKNYYNEKINVIIDNISNYPEICILSKDKINFLIKQKLKRVLNENYY